MKFNRLLVYALTGVYCLAFSPEADAETMREAVAAALASHPALDVATAQKDIESEKESAERSNLFPEISTSATGGRMFGNNSTTRGLVTSRGEAYSWLWEGSASITQPIFNGFETYNRIDAAKAREASADLTLTDARQGIALRAAQAFLNVKRAQEAYDKAASYRDKIADYLKRINGMVEAGAADASEAAQAKNIQAQLDSTVAEMEGALKLAQADYAEATGSMPSGELVYADELSSILFQNVQEAVDYATRFHPLVLSSRRNVEAEEEEVSAEKGTLFPDLNGELSYLKRDQKEEIGGEVVDSRAVMRMNWNFSTGGGQLARIRQAKAERSEALARNAQTQRQIERDVRRAFAEFETAQKQKELVAKKVNVTRDLFNTYEKQFEASKVRILQLMQSENQLFSSELEQINAGYRVIMAEYGLMAGAGRLLDVLNIEEKQTVTADAKLKPQQNFAAEKTAEAPNPVYPVEDYSKENMPPPAEK
jgi:adhesin transport system outer membrane protein